MRTTKLTLSADRELVEKARELAEKEGTSLSSMFSRFLRAALAKRREPLTRKATGLVKLPPGKSGRELIVEALEEKYRR